MEEKTEQEEGVDFEMTFYEVDDEDPDMEKFKDEKDQEESLRKGDG